MKAEKEFDWKTGFEGKLTSSVLYIRTNLKSS